MRFALPIRTPLVTNLGSFLFALVMELIGRRSSHPRRVRECAA